MYYGKSTILRGMELDDAKMIHKSWNDLELRHYLGSQLPNSYEDEVEFVKNTMKNRANGTAYHFIIDDLDGNYLGTIGLFGVDKIHRSAVLGIAIHKKNNRGKGLGTDAIITLLTFGFTILNLHRIELEYLENNPAHSAYEKAGFTEVGRKRDAIFHFGKYIDLVQMDILVSEFITKYPSHNLFKR